MKKRRIIILGFMASCPVAGVIWQHLHYIVGLKRLGHDVYYIEDYVPYYRQSFTCAAATLRSLAEAFGFENRWAYCARSLTPAQSFGFDLPHVRQLYREADAIFNICGAQEVNEDIVNHDRLIMVESDPGVDQLRVDLGDTARGDFLAHHRMLFTFGENVGSASFPVPLHDLRWLPTRQPVIIEFWKTESSSAQHDAVFTTVANWSTRGIKDVKWNGETFTWSKAESFLKFANAPQAMGQTIELGAEIQDQQTIELLLSKGWRLNPNMPSADRTTYRQFIQNSLGEFTVAKDVYVRLNTGWFSDRSACYLAAGRPVVTQETGFTRFYGGHQGLLSFSNVEEIKEAGAAIRADYPAHSRAAYEIAREFFAAEKVLSSLLERAGI